MSSKSPTGKTRKSTTVTSKAPRRDPSERVASSPDITVERRPMGRDTLHAIWEEMQQSPQPRPPLVTVGYDEVPVDDPNQPKPPPARPQMPSGPEITISEVRPGFSTLIAIEEALGEEKQESEHPQAYAESQVLELFTFVILDGVLTSAASEDEKRAFVAERLWHRLPQGGVSTIRRVEVRPADGGALLMRVWCSVPRVLI